MPCGAGQTALGMKSFPCHLRSAHFTPLTARHRGQSPNSHPRLGHQVCLQSAKTTRISSGGFCTYWPLQGVSLNVLRDLEISVIHSPRGPPSVSLGLLLGALFPKLQGLTCICFIYRLTQYRPHRRLDFLKPQWLCSDFNCEHF